MTAKIIPFPTPQPERVLTRPTDAEMTVYRMMTKGWSEQMKQLVCPAHYARERGE